ncbi:NRDE family protein [Skermanella rosea]|uniref:NRDE family protein n=1 Tax=Skermanella rosea TaxID=1817965 RepID=UPI001933E1D8|nr:NRDE family protein [Skermanella rosea]UEM06058.1 NRDE family protein [Skermanella rosea]
MCSIVILRQPGATYPLIIGGNRDEMAGRPWKPPARHWPERPDVLGGIDELAGGSWLALNDTGVVAVVLNRMGTLGPEPGKRSRGELVLDALDHADAADAAGALVHLDPAAYRPFNLVVADNRDAFWLTRRAEGTRVEIERIPEGVSMVTANDLNDDSSNRIRFYRPLFAHAAAPDPAAGDWKAWEELLGSRIWDGDAGPRGAMCVVTPTGFGTTSSALLALPSAEHPETKPVFRFCPGRPDETPWTEVDLS